MNLDLSPASFRAKTVVTALTLLAALACFAQLSRPQPATADVASPNATIGFCENAEIQNIPCRGLPTENLYQVFGYGDEHSVCVGIADNPDVRRCSSGAGAGVYSGEIPTQNEIPEISDNAPGPVHVHGLALTR